MRRKLSKTFEKVPSTISFHNFIGNIDVSTEDISDCKIEYVLLGDSNLVKGVSPDIDLILFSLQKESLEVSIDFKKIFNESLSLESNLKKFIKFDAAFYNSGKKSTLGELLYSIINTIEINNSVSARIVIPKNTRFLIYTVIGNVNVEGDFSSLDIFTGLGNIYTKVALKNDGEQNIFSLLGNTQIYWPNEVKTRLNVNNVFLGQTILKLEDVQKYDIFAKTNLLYNKDYKLLNEVLEEADDLAWEVNNNVLPFDKYLIPYSEVIWLSPLLKSIDFGSVSLDLSYDSLSKFSFFGKINSNVLGRACKIVA